MKGKSLFTHAFYGAIAPSAHGLRSFYASASPCLFYARRVGIFSRQMAMITIETEARQLQPLHTSVPIVIVLTRTGLGFKSGSSANAAAVELLPLLMLGLAAKSDTN